MGGHTTVIGFPGLQVDLKRKQTGYCFLKYHVAQFHAVLHIDCEQSHTIIAVSRSNLVFHLKPPLHQCTVVLYIITIHWY